MWYKYIILGILFLLGLFSPSFIQLFEQFSLPSWSIPVFAISLYLPFWAAISSKISKYELIPILLVAVLSFGYELLSINFGFPYGTFVYGDLMGGLKIFGQVPLTLPLIYLPMVIGSVIISKELGLSKFMTIILASILLSLLDIVIDPSLTREGIWTWTGSLLGINIYQVPIQNFFGWFLTSLLSTSILYNIKIPKEFLTTSGFSFTLFFWLGKSIQYQFWISALVGLTVISSIYFISIKR